MKAAFESAQFLPERIPDLFILIPDQHGVFVEYQNKIVSIRLQIVIFIVIDSGINVLYHILKIVLFV